MNNEVLKFACVLGHPKSTSRKFQNFLNLIAIFKAPIKVREFEFNWVNCVTWFDQTQPNHFDRTRLNLLTQPTEPAASDSNQALIEPLD